MLYRLMKECNNYFKVDDLIQRDISVTFSGSNITFPEEVTDLLVGQYILIKYSMLNDGVYKITGITNDVVTVAETLLDETSEVTCYGLAVPKDFVDLASSINTFTSGVTKGIVSKKQGDKSETYATTDWKKEYKSDIALYRQLRW